MPLLAAMNDKESKAFMSVRAYIPDITNCLKTNRATKEALIMEYQKLGWIPITAIPSETELVTLALDRISNDAGQYNIFMQMLENIAGINLIVDKLKGIVADF